jgi:hypothetical protein
MIAAIHLITGDVMANLAQLPAVLVDHRPRFPTRQLRLEHKRLKITVVATFEIASNEARDEIERNVAQALAALALHGRLDTVYEVIR